MRKYFLISTVTILGLLFFVSSFQLNTKKSKPKISFSFDDGSVRDFQNYPNVIWNQMLLDNLKKHKLRSILYVKGKGLDNKKGKKIIESWNNYGNLIGNHTYNHLSFNREDVSLETFKKELLKDDSLISSYSNYTKLFRFPYLSEGNTIEKRDGFREFLQENDYKIGHVTIDASDWYIDSRLTKRLKKDPGADISGFKEFYIKHLFDRATYYDSLGIELTGRQVNHILLLHHNLSAALFLDDLIKHFEKNGWEIVDVDKAYQDEIYTKAPQIIPAGGSLIWALAKQAGTYEAVLRYPAEDSRYEKVAMDSLGVLY
jgi:peptidoglycan/xylan/chitin deacetylase (PgdA/CDA1 family)